MFNQDEEYIKLQSLLRCRHCFWLHQRRRPFSAASQIQYSYFIDLLCAHGGTLKLAGRHKNLGIGKGRNQLGVPCVGFCWNCRYYKHLAGVTGIAGVTAEWQQDVVDVALLNVASSQWL
jgi:hypothetical protein